MNLILILHRTIYDVKTLIGRVTDLHHLPVLDEYVLTTRFRGTNLKLVNLVILVLNTTLDRKLMNFN